MSDSDFELSLSEAADGVGLIRFADRGRQNQLCWAAVGSLADALDQCVQRDLRVVVISSAAPGHWLEHAWLRDLQAALEGEATTGDGLGWFRAINGLSRPPLVSIAAINGNTCGGGCELGWACDLRVAERQALFAQPEIHIGITPGVGGISRLNTLVGRGLASEMAFSGHWVTAERLYHAGAINRLVEEGGAEREALAWAQQLAAQPVEALRLCKQTMADCQELPLQEALQREQQTFQQSAQPALDMIRAQQARYDAGATTAELFKTPEGAPARS
ncbi:MAG: enoyl-CoA hydratase/isomerase family protein [Halieaceae bacterium]